MAQEEGLEQRSHQPRTPVAARSWTSLGPPRLGGRVILQTPCPPAAPGPQSYERVSQGLKPSSSQAPAPPPATPPSTYDPY